MSFKKYYIISFFIFSFSGICNAENAFYSDIKSPNDNTVFISGKETSVIFEFDAESANKENAWLVVKFNSQIARTIIGTTIESPFSFDIPSNKMTSGKHSVEFELLQRKNGKDEILTSSVFTLDVKELSELSENSIDAEITSHKNNEEFVVGLESTFVFEFDADTANASETEMIFLFDDKSGEIESALESPFDLEVPGRLMTPGEHSLKFILVDSCKDTEKILAYADIKIIVKEKNETIENAFYAAVTIPNLESELTAGKETVVTVEFDEQAANDINAWIVVLFDEMNASTVFGTSIESPYSLDIPGELMKKGNHTVKFLFMDKVNGIEKVISNAEILLNVTN